jgi:dTDP-3,4-didehydro-2,6-dideoxy-alpha-D-glucose 3-reductase
VKVLVLGYSSLVQRRVLPALSVAESVDTIHIASRRELPATILGGSRGGQLILGYDEALAQLEPGLAYISLPNSLHYEWCIRALTAGFHVIIDKPAFLDAGQAMAVRDLARAKGLCCAEAIVWPFHPMLEILADLSKREARRPVAAYACFASPALDPENFRLNGEMGGGVIYDRASYAISCGRVVYGEEPTGVACAVIERDSRTGLDLSCRISLQYSGGSSLEGFYSLKTDYRNSLSVVGETYNLDFERIFSPPNDYTGPAIVRRKGKAESLVTRPANTFALFLDGVIGAIEDGSAQRFAERLVTDAVIMDSIRASA